MVNQVIRAKTLLLLCFLGLPFASCNYQRCEQLRDELESSKRKWQACTRDQDCIIVGGNAKDCTGILSCNLSVNKAYRDDAERRIASLPEDSVDCMTCNSPNCIVGEISLCEQVTHQCIVVTEILDGGGTSQKVAPPPDAGTGAPEPDGEGGSEG